MLGGYYGSAYNTDIWEWDTTTGVWAQLMPAVGSPDRRRPLLPRRSRTTRSGACCVLVGGYRERHGRHRRRQRFVGVGREPAALDRDDAAGGQAGAALPPPDGVRLRCAGRPTCSAARSPTTPTYGPSEFWEYLPNATARPNGAGLLGGGGRRCMSGNCVDGVCCAQTAAECAGTCRSCNVAGSAGTCTNVPAGLPDDTCPSDQACDAAQQCKKRARAGVQPVQRVRDRPLRRRRLLRHRLQRHVQAVQPGREARHLLVRADGRRGSGGRAGLRVRSRTAARFCDGAGNCTNCAKAIGKPCTASGQCASDFCIDGVCCNSALRADLLPVQQGRARSGRCSVIAAGQQDHSATTPCDAPMQYCTARAPARRTRSRTARPAPPPPTAAAASASTASAATAPARAPASRATCRARWGAA